MDVQCGEGSTLRDEGPQVARLEAFHLVLERVVCVDRAAKAWL